MNPNDIEMNFIEIRDELQRMYKILYNQNELLMLYLKDPSVRNRRKLAHFAASHPIAPKGPPFSN